MKNDYLWDRNGEPDPEIARLEEVLRPLRHRGRPLAMPTVPEWSIRPGRWPARIGWQGTATMLALAATLVLLVSGTWPYAVAPASQWTVEVGPVSGSGPGTVRAGNQLKADEWIVTGKTSRARLRAKDVGVVEIEPGSRVRLVRSGGEEHRLALSVGVLHAFIWAPPGQFYVQTPSATAIDLGCAYTLEVDRAGNSRLHVTAGWVGLAHNGHEAFVPTGAMCVTQPDGSPGTPRLEDVEPGFADALDALDRMRPAGSDANALDVVLRHARHQDAFSLWHLLTSLPAADAARVYARLAVLAPPPPIATLERVLARDREALDAWWDSLGLGDTRWYRTYRAKTGAR